MKIIKMKARLKQESFRHIDCVFYKRVTPLKSLLNRGLAFPGL